MEQSIINAIIVIVGSVIGNYALKLGRAAPLIKKVFKTAIAIYESKSDGKLTMREKARIYDEVEEDIQELAILAKEAWSVVKGMTFMKSKV